ncbi:hypothetical protein [uncultured Microbulbifer sp.]|uniref:hypothetical protein n=1 Tax=uncultured Microbulbifer sp. TaxID=348147 RepID=UPI002613639A|nr:hypothetical protein [uncultured Microbulbifer sp.]
MSEMAMFGPMRELLDKIEGNEELQREFAAKREKFADGSGLDAALSEFEIWGVELRLMIDRIDQTFLDFPNKEAVRQSNPNLFDEMFFEARKKKEAHLTLLPFVTQYIGFYEGLRSNQVTQQQLEISNRATQAAESGVEVAREGVKVAAGSTKAAQKSATAAEASAEIARSGAVHTRRGVWVAAGSAVVAALALCWQIYSQNKDVSVNLNSPVVLQPATLSDESISSLTHAIAVELSKAKGEQVTLSPESIEGLRAVLRLELERGARIEVVETKEDVEQKAN